MLADNVKHPFCEYLSYLLNFGVIGLLLLIAFSILIIYCYKGERVEKQIISYTLIQIGIFSLFSYPFTYPFTWIIIFVSVFIIMKIQIKKLLSVLWRKNIVCTVLLMATVVGIYKISERIWLEREWAKTSMLALCKKYEVAIPLYEKLNSRFNKNPYFLYNYAAVLTENKEYQRALEVALCCHLYWADYDLELMIGENYQRLKRLKQAEIHYNNASMMCPSRFLPLNFQYDLYQEMGEEQKALEIAIKAIKKPVKVRSLIVKQIRYKMKQALLKAETQKLN